ncbi:MAG: xanthine dehydrogenase family protein subunit M [Gallionellaceae bacterium]|nr:xanthine dehydrogenase family protein subunit M [Gallionellaceae bacterium]
MKASAFSYAKPSSLSELFDLMEMYGDRAKLLAGGQSLIAALNMRLASPTVLLDINGITELSGIEVKGDVVRIGALTRHRSLEQSAEIKKHLPLVHKAMPFVAHAAIRTRGTFGGSVAFADAAAELPACCVVLDANIELASRKGRRIVSARNFFKGLYETDLQPDEVLISAEFPKLRVGYRSAFLELARRHGDYAVVGVAVHGKFQDDMFSDISMVFFGVADRPVHAVNAGRALESARLSPSTINTLRSAVSLDLETYGDIYHTAETKLHLAKVLAGRAVSIMALGRET